MFLGFACVGSVTSSFLDVAEYCPTVRIYSLSIHLAIGLSTWAVPAWGFCELRLHVLHFLTQCCLSFRLYHSSECEVLSLGSHYDSYHVPLATDDLQHFFTYLLAIHFSSSSSQLLGCFCYRCGLYSLDTETFDEYFFLVCGLSINLLMYLNDEQEFLILKKT